MRRKESQETIRGKRTLTLFELFITIALLACVGAVVISRALPMLDHYRFEADAKRFEKEILLTKRLADTAHADVQFVVKRGKKGYECKRLTDEPIRMDKLMKKKLSFPHIDSILVSGSKIDRESVTFTGTGWTNQNGEWDLVSKFGENYKIKKLHS